MNSKLVILPTSRVSTLKRLKLQGLLEVAVLDRHQGYATFTSWARGAFFKPYCNGCRVGERRRDVWAIHCDHPAAIGAVRVLRRQRPSALPSARFQGVTNG